MTGNRAAFFPRSLPLVALVAGALLLTGCVAVPSGDAPPPVVDSAPQPAPAPSETDQQWSEDDAASSEGAAESGGSDGGQQGQEGQGSHGSQGDRGEQGGAPTPAPTASAPPAAEPEAEPEPEPTQTSPAPQPPAVTVLSQKCTSGKLTLMLTASANGNYRKGITKIVVERANEYNAWVGGEASWLGAYTGAGDQWTVQPPGSQAQRFKPLLRITATSDEGLTTRFETAVTSPC